MSENYYGFEKFCKILGDSSILKKHSVMGVIRMLQLCITEIKSEVLLKLSKEGANDYYLDYLKNEIKRQDYLKDYNINKISHILEDLGITVDNILDDSYPYELNNKLDVTLNYDNFYENFDYLRKTQDGLLLYFLNYYANELITFLNSIKSNSTQKNEVNTETSNNVKIEDKKNVYSSISFSFDKEMSVEEFHNKHKVSDYFKEPLSKNSNFLRELFEFLCDENRPVRTTYEIFDKKLNLYLINGHPLFYMRFSTPSSVKIYPASLKMQYLEQLKERKNELRFYDKKQLDEVISETYDSRDVYTKKFSDFFNYDENIKNNSNIYSAILLQAVRKLLETTVVYYKDYTPEQILGFNDNSLNIVKSEIVYSFQTFHNLIKHIGLNHTPYLEHKAVEFISRQINILNKNVFEFSYLFEVLESEANKINNERVYEKIIQKNKLLETHKYYENREDEKSKKETQKNRGDIFKNQDSQDWFHNTLQELAAIDNKNKPERSFQAICNAIFRDKVCKDIILKNRLSLKRYIQFLNEEYKAGIKNETNLSNHQNYITDVAGLIKLYQNNVQTNKPE